MLIIELPWWKVLSLVNAKICQMKFTQLNCVSRWLIYFIPLKRSGRIKKHMDSGWNKGKSMYFTRLDFQNGRIDRENKNGKMKYFNDA